MRGSMQSLMLQLLEGHLREHVQRGASKQAEADIEPVLSVLRSYVK